MLTTTDTSLKGHNLRWTKRKKLGYNAGPAWLNADLGDVMMPHLSLGKQTLIILIDNRSDWVEIWKVNGILYHFLFAFYLCLKLRVDIHTFLNAWLSQLIRICFLLMKVWLDWIEAGWLGKQITKDRWKCCSQIIQKWQNFCK